MVQLGRARRAPSASFSATAASNASTTRDPDCNGDVRMTLKIYAEGTNEAARAAAEAIGRLFDQRRIERKNVAHVARDGRGIDPSRGIGAG